MASNDIPPWARGTVQFGRENPPMHYMRSDKTGQLFVVNGPDTRDWGKIAAGALDYSHVAFQEHQATPKGQKFAGHDGKKAHDACEICALEENRPPVQAYAVPDEVPADVAATNAAHAARQAAIEEQARKDAADKALLPPSPEVRADMEKAAAQDKTIAELQAMVAALSAQIGDTAIPKETTVSEQAAGITGAADPAHNAGVPPTDPDVVAGATPDIQAQSAAALANPAVTEPESRPEMGVDPWTGEPVKIFWNIPGASPTHPYGAKKDGSPRRAVGRKQGS